YYPFGADRRCAAAGDVAGLHGALRGGETSGTATREQVMTSPQLPGPLEIVDPVPPDNPGALEIGFALPERYNASRILFDNLARGRGDRLALTGPLGPRRAAEVCAAG